MRSNACKPPDGFPRTGRCNRIWRISQRWRRGCDEESMGDITNDRVTGKYGQDHQPPAYSWWERTLARLLAPDSAIHLTPKRKWDWNDHGGLLVFGCLIGGI